MIVYYLQPAANGWRILRNGRPLARYASVERALAIAERMARRERETLGVEADVHPLSVPLPPRGGDDPASRR